MSHKMSPQKWAEATMTYNTRLHQAATEQRRQYVAKHPRALIDKLSAIEGQVFQRLASGNYNCEY